MSELFESRSEGGATVFTFRTPNLDQRARGLVEEALVELAEQSDNVVLNMEQVEFADSNGLRMIQNLIKRIRTGVSLINVGSRLERCFERIPESRRPTTGNSIPGKSITKETNRERVPDTIS